MHATFFLNVENYKNFEFNYILNYYILLIINYINILIIFEILENSGSCKN